MRKIDPYARYLKFGIYLLVVVLVNLAGTTLFFRFDLTANQMYSISKASQKAVATLSEPLTIHVFFTKNLPAPYNNVERYLHDLLEEYSMHADRFFSYRFYNVNPDKKGISPSSNENQKIANNYGIHPIQIQAVEKDEVKFKKAYMGLVLIHGDMVERIPTITSVEGLEYKLTTTISKLNNKVSAFLNLPQKIRLTLYLSSSLKQVAPVMGLEELSDYPQKVEAIVARLNTKTYDKLEYKYVDPSQNPTAEKAAHDYNMVSLNWPALSGGRIPAGKGSIGLLLTLGDKHQVMRLLNVIRIPIIGTQYDLVRSDRLEELIQTNLEALIDINEDLGYLADHGTLQMGRTPMMTSRNPEALSVFSTLLSQNYSLKSVTLKEADIPEGLNCLIIARPTQNFSDYALYQIDQALMRGTSLALFLDAFNEITANQSQAPALNRPPAYVPLDTGLEKLLDHYGIRVKKSILLDENCHRQMMPQMMGGGEQPIYFAPIIKNQNINHDLEFMQSIKGLITLKMSPLELNDKQIADNKLKATRVFSSSKKSWEMRKNINLNPLFLKPPTANTDQRSFPLAYVLEGKFPSYFAGKPIPVKEALKGEESKDTKSFPSTKPNQDLAQVKGKGGFLAQGKSAQIFLIGSSEILKDRIMDPGGKSPNAMFLMNVIDVLNQREDIAIMRSKIQEFNPLQSTSAAAKTFIKAFNIAGLPILVVFFGLFVWLRRHTRRKRLQMMFQE